MASDPGLGRGEDRPPDDPFTAALSPMSRMGSLIGTVSQSARRRFGMLREHRLPNQSEPSMTPVEYVANYTKADTFMNVSALV